MKNVQVKLNLVSIGIFGYFFNVHDNLKENESLFFHTEIKIDLTLKLPYFYPVLLLRNEVGPSGRNILINRLIYYFT